jgi:hypothetical protein
LAIDDGGSLVAELGKIKDIGKRLPADGDALVDQAKRARGAVWRACQSAFHEVAIAIGDVDICAIWRRETLGKRTERTSCGDRDPQQNGGAASEKHVERRRRRGELASEVFEGEGQD